MARKKESLKKIPADPVATVAMVRSEEAANGGPTTADVHPDEVENFKKGGWSTT